MRADLHVHSTASDGVLTPAELVELAAASNVDVLAIADHDSVDGVPLARQRAHELGITLIPAVEFSATDNGRDVHLLGYFIDTSDEELRRHLTRLRAARDERAGRIVSALREAGYDIESSAVSAIAAGGSVGRSHIARALVDAGAARTTTEAFERFIGRDGPFYQPKETGTPSEVVGLIRRAGGLAVLAHPGVNRADDIIDSLVQAGLGGIEAYHADHSAEERARYAQLGSDLGLLLTGGSDYHGPDAPNPPLGSVEIPAEHVAALLAWGRTTA